MGFQCFVQPAPALDEAVVAAAVVVEVVEGCGSATARFGREAVKKRRKADGRVVVASVLPRRANTPSESRRNAMVARVTKKNEDGHFSIEPSRPRLGPPLLSRRTAGHGRCLAPLYSALRI